jgi:hypothetical protein
MGIIRLFLAIAVATGHWRVLAIRQNSTEIGDWPELGFNAGYAVFFST